jgi:indolepyruvate ferredoxin oxidoreductase beta subunit
MYVNANPQRFPRKEVKAFLDKREITTRSAPAGTIALDLGAPLCTNLALLGYFTAFNEGPTTQAELRNTIESISPDRFREINLKVFEAGLQTGLEETS